MGRRNTNSPTNAKPFSLYDIFKNTMKIKIAFTFCLLFSATLFAQKKPVGHFEHKYFTNEGFGQIFNIDFLQNDSFHISMFHDQKCYERTENISGLFKVKNDTLILITPISKKLFTTFKDTSILGNQFVYSINKFKYYSDIKPYLTYLKFYFLDTKFNLIGTNPIQTKIVVDTLFKDEIKYDEISLKFNIPPDAIYFIAREGGGSTTFNISDIQGKLFTDKIRSKEKQFDTELEDYLDLTFEKYLLNKKRTRFSSVEQKFGPTAYLMTIQYDKK